MMFLFLQVEYGGRVETLLLQVDYRDSILIATQSNDIYISTLPCPIMEHGFSRDVGYFLQESGLVYREVMVERPVYREVAVLDRQRGGCRNVGIPQKQGVSFCQRHQFCSIHFSVISASLTESTPLYSPLPCQRCRDFRSFDTYYCST